MNLFEGQVLFLRTKKGVTPLKLERVTKRKLVFASQKVKISELGKSIFPTLKSAEGV